MAATTREKTRELSFAQPLLKLSHRLKYFPAVFPVHWCHTIFIIFTWNVGFSSPNKIVSNTGLKHNASFPQEVQSSPKKKLIFLDFSPRFGRLLPVMRHTSATTLLDKGNDLRTVQVSMGYSHIRTTEAYLHSTDDRKVEVIISLQVLELTAILFERGHPSKGERRPWSLIAKGLEWRYPEARFFTGATPLRPNIINEIFTIRIANLSGHFWIVMCTLFYVYNFMFIIFIILLDFC